MQGIFTLQGVIIKIKKNITGGKTKHAYSAEGKDPFTPS
jgi:hypothetical protein